MSSRGEVLSGRAIAIGTRWAMGPLLLARLRRALELGFTNLAIHEDVREPEWEEILEFLPRHALIGISLFAPLPRVLRPGEERTFRLGSLHPEERRDAASQGLKTLEMADRAEVPVVIIPQARLEQPSSEEVLPLLAKKKRARTWEALRAKRAECAPLQLDSYMSTLRRLLDRADRYALALALEIGGPPSELPDIDEALRCLVEFEGAPLFLWPNLLQDSRYRRTGGSGAERLQEELSSRVLGIAVEDGDGERRRLPLGAGEVKLEVWERFKAAGPAPAPKVPPPPGGAAAPGPSPSELIRGSPRAPPVRVFAIDLAPEASEEALLETRGALERFLSPPEKTFDPFGAR